MWAPVLMSCIPCLPVQHRTMGLAHLLVNDVCVWLKEKGAIRAEFRSSYSDRSVCEESCTCKRICFWSRLEAIYPGLNLAKSSRTGFKYNLQERKIVKRISHVRSAALNMVILLIPSFILGWRQPHRISKHPGEVMYGREVVLERDFCHGQIGYTQIFCRLIESSPLNIFFWSITCLILNN